MPTVRPRLDLAAARRPWLVGFLGAFLAVCIGVFVDDRRKRFGERLGEIAEHVRGVVELDDVVRR